MKKMNRQKILNLFTYGLVIIAYIILQTMLKTGNIKSVVKGMLVPICAYIVMAVSLNLTVGVLGQLELLQVLQLLWQFFSDIPRQLPGFAF